MEVLAYTQWTKQPGRLVDSLRGSRMPFRSGVGAVLMVGRAPKGA